MARENYGAAQRMVAEALRHEGDDCLIWPFAKSSNGYGAIKLPRATVSVHRHVCTLAHGDPPPGDIHASHSCGTKLCINPKHLRWATRAFNEHDKIGHGTSNRGSRHGLSKLTEENVRSILEKTKTAKEYAAEFGVKPEAVYKIMRGERWTHLT